MNVRFMIAVVLAGSACTGCFGGGAAAPTATHQTGSTTSPRPKTVSVVIVRIPPVEGKWPIDPPSPIASAPVVLYAPPAVIVKGCLAAQARAPIALLCPTLLPRPRLPQIRGGSIRKQPWHFYPQSGLPRGIIGVDLGYGAPWESGSGRGWRGHLWRNRPCCFLHFIIQTQQPGEGFSAPGERPATIGGIHGELAPANGAGGYFGNHVRFFFRRNGVHWLASLHSFGPGTQALLSRIVRGLRPLNHH